MLHADEIRIDTDEGRITLVVSTDEGLRPLVIDIHDVALGFYDEVRRELGPYVYEAEQARIAVASGVSREEYLARDVPQPVTTRPVSVEDAIEAGYALDDPKSPGYHDRMVGDH